MNHEEALERVPVGVLMVDGNGKHWLRLRDDDFHHTSGCAVNIITADIIHISKLPLPIYFSHYSEVVM